MIREQTILFAHKGKVSLFGLFYLQVETREDEEQNVKLNQTIELLLAAGYFRARIKGLSPFDKVARFPIAWTTNRGDFFVTSMLRKCYNIIATFKTCMNIFEYLTEHV